MKLGLSIDQIRTLPPETLAMRLLVALDPRRNFRRGEIINSIVLEAEPPQGAGVRSSAEIDQRHPGLVIALVEAWQRLVLDGLLVNWPPQDPHYQSEGHGEMFQMTRLGRQIRQHGEQGARVLDAKRRIGLDLHPELAAKVRDSIAVTDFEQAALIALRTIETRVRGLTHDPRSSSGQRVTGTRLMNHAFAPGGPLSDPEAEHGEQVGTMSLFAGAFGAIRNSLAHTEVQWPDPVEAAEYVLLADLLMRLLDRAERRLQV
jgi:uncharacterized protein (TIGR02391 family)